FPTSCVRRKSPHRAADAFQYFAQAFGGATLLEHRKRLESLDAAHQESIRWSELRFYRAQHGNVLAERLDARCHYPSQGCIQLLDEWTRQWAFDDSVELEGEIHPRALPGGFSEANGVGSRFLRHDVIHT